MNVKTLSVQCPICNKEVLMTGDSPFRPFCSKRCKLIDLGEWASESRVIEGETIENDDDVWTDDLPEN
ncbi:DNA gyrase inhibitor YacG [Thalassocella blandensis]|nr:DNA gyrase inhibitor YacG [Thalassocella blandensis]